MTKNKNICVISTVHPDHDTRILKQCRSLSEYFFVDLIIQSKKLSYQNIKILPLPLIRNRLQRVYLIMLATRLAFKKKYSFYIFHDPELIFLGILLKLFGKKVIYDVHEDYESQILDKHWIPSYLRKVTSIVFSFIERISSKLFDSIVCATPFIHNKFSKINNKSFCVRNFPPSEELFIDDEAVLLDEQRVSIFKILYVGVISEERSIIKILDSIKNIDCELTLGGNFSPPSLQKICEEHESWKKVRYLGFIDRLVFAKVLNESDVGILLFQPLKNHIDALPNKMFEYMAGGLFQISSNFKEWKVLVEGNSIGITIDPEDSKMLTKTLIELQKNKSHLQNMRSNIRRIYMKNFTWDKEKFELLKAFDIDG
jgi:glycosyltransferase involved in cell wall biosynthesis